MKYKREDMVLFWGGDFEHAKFSQWARIPIVVDDMEFNCNEQFMMSSKARLFGDYETEAKIMATKNPREQKEWGRQVKGFTVEKWVENARLIVYRGNLAKFSQHPALRAELMGTGHKRIVEASAHDTVWGIGLAPDDPRCLDTDLWLGTNWLGDAIQKVRSDLRSIYGEKHFGIEEAI